MRPSHLLFALLLMLLIYPNHSVAQQNVQESTIVALLKNAEQGNAADQYGLGVVYARGLGVASNYDKALKWFRKAAEQGHALAQFSLGEAYSRGVGVTQDYVEAEKWFRKAAEEGNSAAQVSLGTICIQGIGVTQNYVEAEKWFRKAAEKGNHTAQSLLGTMYAEGLGVASDYIEAYLWLTLSIAGSRDQSNPFFQKATDLRDSVCKKMTAQQIEEAQKLAKEWRPPRSPRRPGNVQESKLIWNVEAIYPELAKRAQVTGTVTMIVAVDEGGNVTNIRISSGHPMLNEAAATAVRQWKYTPTLLNGDPVPVTVTVTVSFNLRQK